MHKPKIACAQCERSFLCQAALREHQRSAHASGGGGNALHCPLCSRAFSSKAGLLGHGRAKHQTGNLQCMECSYVTKIYSCLWHHIFTKHEQRKYACHVCGLLFYLPATFSKHLRSHGLTPEPGYTRFRFAANDEGIFQLLSAKEQDEAPSLV